MPKLIVYNVVSLDGYHTGPEGVERKRWTAHEAWKSRMCATLYDAPVGSPGVPIAISVVRAHNRSAGVP